MASESDAFECAMADAKRRWVEEVLPLFRDDGGLFGHIATNVGPAEALFALDRHENMRADIALKQHKLAEARAALAAQQAKDGSATAAQDSTAQDALVALIARHADVAEPSTENDA